VFSRLLLSASLVLSVVAILIGFVTPLSQALAAPKPGDRWCDPRASLTPCACAQYNNEVLPQYPNDGKRTGCFLYNGPVQYQCGPYTSNTCVVTTTTCAAFFYIPYAARSDTSSNVWNSSVMRDSSDLA
jgi:hypothetical protein